MLGKVRSMILRLLPESVAGRLRAWNSRRVIQAFPKYTTEHRYGSGRLKVMIADPLGRGWYDHDWDELPEVTELRKTKLKAGATVFDLGAHQGVVALMLAREAGATGKVIAVEANRHNANVAIENAKLNAVSTIEIIHAAIADRNGTLVFSENCNGQIDDGSGREGRVTVDSITIDTLADKHGMPNVVVLDIEGAECMALSAAANVLASDADFFVEVHVGCGLEKLGGTVEKVLSYFPEDRYRRLARAEDDTAFRPVADNDPLFRDRFFLLALRTR